MTIKYEAVFGNQELFDGAGTFTGLDVVVHSIASGIKSYARISDLTPESLRNHPVCAMRRIIKTPTWTRADQEAGVLPPVGAKAMQCNEYCTVDILSVHHGYIVVCNSDIDDSKPVSFAIEKFIELFNPIETPEEKAQREQEEFVASFNSEKYSNPTLYREGLRDAYHKLKGGE